MAIRPLNTLKGWFVTAAKPIQDQFWDWIDSFRHKSEAIPMADVNGLTDIINSLVPATTFNAFEQGELIEYNAPATYAIPAGYELEKVFVYYPGAGVISMSLVQYGDQELIPEVEVVAGWNRKIDIGIVAVAATNVFINSIPVGSKILFIKRKLKMV